MKRRYKYKPIIIGNSQFRRTGKNKLALHNDKDGFKINLIFLADEKTHTKVIEEVNSTLLESIVL